MKVGEKVKFEPSDKTRGYCVFHAKYGPKIGHVYQIVSIDEMGNIYFMNGFGPYLMSDVKLVDINVNAEEPIPFPPLKELLSEDGVTVPDIQEGDIVEYLAEWATAEAASQIGFPIKGNVYRVEKIDQEQLSLKLEGFAMLLSSWHFRKVEA